MQLDQEVCSGVTPAVVLEEMPAAAAVLPCAVTRRRQGSVSEVSDVLAQEVPVALVYNGLSHVVMMATPADLVDFAYGFSYTEGIIDQPGQIYGVELALVNASAMDAGIEVHIELASAQFAKLKAHRRNLTGRTGCGLCGAESLQQVFKQPAHPASHPLPLRQAAIHVAFGQLPPLQLLQQQTGATHACAIVDMDGQIQCLREDVGRHNALDKVLGASLRSGQGTGLTQHWVLTTSRASYEMVQKVAMAGGSALVAMSAPTALAVRLAKQYQILLVGFAKAEQCVAYHGIVHE